MYRWTSSIAPKLRKALHDRRGVASLVFVVAAVALIGATGFAVDVGVLLNARQVLQANTNAAVLDAAYQWDQTGGTQSAAVSAAQTWNAAHPVPLVSSITANASALCVGASQTSGLPSCVAGTSNNAVTLTQTGTVPTYFVRVLGFDSWTVSAKATAAKAGGPTKALNVMFVLDTTRSMGTTTDDTGCAVPGISSPTKLDCATYGVQLILKQLNPAIDKVGLMIFPGMSSSWTPCTGSPSIVPYGSTGMTYQINSSSLSTDYANPQGTLNDSSKLVMAVGDNKNGLTGCLQTLGSESKLGGMGTFYADAISAAQAALTSQGSSTAQNVIILLSDGEANATSSDVSSTYPTTACTPSKTCSPGHLEQQCNQAVVYGQDAANAGTWVYVIAYDSSTSTAGTSSSAACPTQSKTTGSGKSQTTAYYYDSPTVTNSATEWSPCSALQNIASDPTKFYSSSATTGSCTSVNPYTDVASDFQQAGVTLSMPRLVLYY